MTITNMTTSTNGQTIYAGPFCKCCGREWGLDDLGDAMCLTCRPDNTDIPGIRQESPGHFAVTFTLYVDATDATQAEDRAMQMRQEFVDGAKAHDFFWHLHDHDGC